MEIERKLDEILKYFELKGHDNSNFDKENLIWGEVAIKVANGNNKFFLMLLNKLEDDGFVESKSFDYYIITVDGLLFNRKGGYVKKQEDIINERKRIKKELITRNLHDWLLIIGSIGAAIGTIGLLFCDK